MFGLLGALLPDAIVTALLFRFFLRDATRARLERFALRQDLVITRANGSVVIDYLAATRRWRVAGFVAGSLVAAGFDWHPHTALQIGFAGPFVGWFVGASTAEWQLGRTGRDGLRRAALLTARRFADYLGRLVRFIVGAVWVALFAIEVDVVVSAQSGRSVLALGLALTLVVAAAQYLVARHVLLRPQVLAAPDVLAADDAIRGRSLHVLAGSSLVIAAMTLDAVLAVGESHVRWIAWGREEYYVQLAVILVPVIGVLVSVLPTRTRRARWARALAVSP